MKLITFQGEYIAPEKIENVYGRSEFVAQTFVYGDSLKSCCVAIIIPDEEVLASWAAKNGKAGKSFDELCCDSVRNTNTKNLFIAVTLVTVNTRNDTGGC